MPETKRIPVQKIYEFIKDVFLKLGAPENDAKICADVLIFADLSGIESHGIGRLYYYYERIKAGVQNIVTEIDIVRDNKSIAVWDGNHGMGHVISYKAMQTAIDKAKKYGMGSVAVRNSTHYGVAGFYPKMAAEQDMIGLTFTNARPVIAPIFGSKPMLGTNPIAFGAPSDCEFPFLYDAATSITQRGKLEVLERKNEPTPEGWVIDNQGNYQTDTKQILRDLLAQKVSFVALGGTTELTGGHKGYGLAAMVEIMSAALQAGSFMHGLNGLENNKRVPYRTGHFFMAMNIDFFIDISEFKKITGDIIRSLQNSEKAPGQNRIYVAGEKEYLNEIQIRKNGVPINTGLQKNINIIINELNLDRSYFGF